MSQQRHFQILVSIESFHKKLQMHQVIKYFRRVFYIIKIIKRGGGTYVPQRQR